MRVYPGTTVDFEFGELGGLGHTGTLNDRQFAALRAEGLDGALTDMFGQFSGLTGSSFTVEQQFTPTSDLADFPVLIDLSQINVDRKDEFWEAARTDGGNIRAYSSVGGTQYPLDIATFNHTAQEGTLWVKVPSIPTAGGVSFSLVLGDMTQTREARDSAYGSAAVWSDYEAVFLGGENTDNRAKTSGLFSINGDAVSFLNVGNPEMTFTADPHQGITWHEASGDVYTSDNNVIRRFDASGTLLASNTNPSGDVEAFLSMATLGHCCDMCVVGNLLIVPINNFPTDTLCALAVFNRETLALINAVNVSAIDPEISGICWNDVTSRLVTCSWGTFTTLFTFTLNTGTGAIAADSSIALNNLTGSGNLNSAVQGIEWWRGHYWMVDDTRDEVLRAKPNGDYNIDDSPIQFSDTDAASVTGNYEGICRYKDGLAVLVDPTSANSYMIYARPANYDFGGGGAKYGTNNGYFETTGLTGGTTFTMAVSAARSANKQSSLLSFRDFSSGGTNDRVTLAHRFVTPNYRIECWDDLNSWLSPGTPVNSTAGVFNRVAVVYNGTARELFIDGTSRATGVGITARDVDFDTLSVGIDDTTAGESFDGDVAFAYVRLEALPTAWLAAEHAMVSSPETFVTIG